MISATYRISHSTTYEYAEPVRICHNVVALTPREDAGLQCHRHQVTIRPAPTVSAKRRDCFGNTINVFSVETLHRRLRISASSRVTVLAREAPDAAASAPWEAVRVAALRADPNWLQASRYAYDSPRIHRAAQYANYSAADFVAAKPIVAATRDLTHRIHTDFKYDTTATHAHTTPEEAFELRSGVCQDFAHIMLACLRSHGLAARYVSGYLRTNPPAGQPRLVGADQSHAWVSVYCGPVGWVDFDPTNDVLCGLNHVPLAWGRDYDDVAPVRGVFLGGGAHTLGVSVDVAPVED